MLLTHYAAMSRLNSTDHPRHDDPDARDSGDLHHELSPGDLSLEEAAWEHEIAALLGGLDLVDPPPGAIDRAMDHRPMFAGRTLVGAGAVLVVLGLGLAFGGALSGLVRPQVDQMAQAHGATEAGLLGGVLPSGAGGVVLEITDEASASDDQAVYAVDGQPASVFRTWGEVDFEALADDGRVVLAGHDAWFDGDDVVVAQVDGHALTIVGADLEVAEQVLSELDLAEPGPWTRILSRLDDLTAGLGFVEVD